jgi:hypothetical protein
MRVNIGHALKLGVAHRATLLGLNSSTAISYSGEGGERLANVAEAVALYAVVANFIERQFERRI